MMLADKHTRNAHLLCKPSDPCARGVPTQDVHVRTPLWSTMMKAFPSGNGCHDPKQADGNNSGLLARCPQNKSHQIPRNKTLPFLVCLASKLRGNQLQAHVAPDVQKTFSRTPPPQYNEPPIPGPSPSSEPHEGLSACEPEPKVAPMQTLEEPFGLYFSCSQIPLTPPSTISRLSSYSLVTILSARPHQRELLPKRILNRLKDWLILASCR
ncbi:hypothetical protein O181_051362 [Austropuccinia psidii MF-1]|uniref:Uncharacterized protein n=1 Tax=Austropuccinia psidii MF-1 TaxID=1389203 RepID=A0A9Q3HPI3_9BASI|nr:hypothetical protein [Austropuccinia psidii MF-1]